MFRLSITSIALLCSFSAFADPIEEPLITPDAIFSVATTDWNNDGIEDPVIILNINNGEQFDGLFYLSDESGRLALLHHIPDIVWGSSVMFGQEPWVTTTQNGSVIVGSQNSAIGRNRWEQKLTIAYRDSQLIVAGYTYSFYDTLDTEAYGGCDLNLLTGKGFKHDKPVKIKAGAMSVAEFVSTGQDFSQFCYSPD